MSAFAAFAMCWTMLWSGFVLAVLLGYQLPFGRGKKSATRTLTLLDSMSIEAYSRRDQE